MEKALDQRVGPKVTAISNTTRQLSPQRSDSRGPKLHSGEG